MAPLDPPFNFSEIVSLQNKHVLPASLDGVKDKWDQNQERVRQAQCSLPWKGEPSEARAQERLGGPRGGGWGHPRVSIPWQEHLALLDVTHGLFSLTASCGYTSPIFSPPRLPYVTWLHFCLLVPPTPRPSMVHTRKFSVDTAVISY